MNGPKRCDTPDKDRYRDWVAASLAAERVARKYGEVQEPYPCGGHWHLRTPTRSNLGLTPGKGKV